MDAGVGSWQRVAAMGYCVCCHLAVPVDYFKIKYFGTIASLGNLAERSSHFIAPLVLIRNCVKVVGFIKQSDPWQLML